MKMFLLGMLVMWIAMNLIVWIADLINEDRAMRKAVPLFYVITFIICEVVPAFGKTIPFIPLCIKYRINPFYTKISIVCKKLNTEKARNEWLNTIKDDRSKMAWIKIFKEFPLETEGYLEELEKKKAQYEKLKEKMQ